MTANRREAEKTLKLRPRPVNRMKWNGRHLCKVKKGIDIMILDSGVYQGGFVDA